MVHIRRNGNALSGLQKYFCARRDLAGLSIGAYGHIRIQHPLIRCPVVHRNIDIIAASVDDVFHLAGMEMHRCRLSFIEHQKFLRISLLIFLRHLLVAVTDRKQ